MLTHASFGQYIVQKYIERPLVALKRKFDLRQWVLVTDWNPLTVWVYAEPYVRFAANDFSFDDLTNKYAHLSNNAVSKFGFQGGRLSHEIPGNMWSLEKLQAYLSEQNDGKDMWEDMRLAHKIKALVINTLISGQDMFE